MILAVAATEIEMDAYLRAGVNSSNETLVSGVGMLESCLNLCRYLEKKHNTISTVVNFGVAGAYFSGEQNMPDLLDMCIAKQEILGDLGICFPRRFDDLGEELGAKKFFPLDQDLAAKANEVAKNTRVGSLSG